MNANDYQEQSKRSMPVLDKSQAMANFALGLAGEAGEVTEHFKKHMFHGRELNVDAVSKELGDVLWYVAALATTLGIQLGDILEQNIMKLQKRYPDGFVTKQSGSGS